MSLHCNFCKKSVTINRLRAPSQNDVMFEWTCSANSDHTGITKFNLSSKYSNPANFVIRNQTAHDTLVRSICGDKDVEKPRAFDTSLLATAEAKMAYMCLPRASDNIYPVGQFP